METQMILPKKTTNMNNVICIVVSLLTGVGTFFTWEKLLTVGVAAVTSIIAGVGVGIILHYCQVYWWKTKPRKNKKK